MDVQTALSERRSLEKSTVLTSPFRTPLSVMGGTRLFFYHLKWAVGYRFIGPASWTRKVRRRLYYEAWVVSHVKGWPGFLLWRAGVRIPFKANVSGKEFNVRTARDRNEFSKQVREVYQPLPFQEAVEGDRIGNFRFKFKGKELSFPYSGNRYGTLVILEEFFIKEPFSGLDVEGLDVVDIGASIGDTPIYFTLKGARRVIALEPYPATYARAEENITSNGLTDRVILLNEGAGASGTMRLTRKERNLWANAVPSEDGVEVRFNSLKDIITRFSIGTAALKLHGEGCEYQLLEEASDEDLQHFPQIALKYHYGAKPIEARLRRAGFEILRRWDLHFSYNSSSSSPRYEAGLILAKLPESIAKSTA